MQQLTPLTSRSTQPTAQPSGASETHRAAILRFLAAAEILETDMWQQYNELAGIQDSEVPGGSGNPAYTEAVAVLSARHKPCGNKARRRQRRHHYRRQRRGLRGAWTRENCRFCFRKPAARARRWSTPAV